MKPRGVVAKHFGLWIRRRQFKSARGYGDPIIEIIGRERKTLELAKECTVNELMENLGLSPESYVPVLNNIPVTGEKVVKSGDHMVFQEVFSGG